MEFDKGIRARFAGTLFSLAFLLAWGMWRLMMVE